MSITEISDNNFEETIKSNNKVLVDCYAPWCSSCKRLYPVFEELSDEETITKFCKINTDENSKITERFDIMSIPTILAFENGRLKRRKTGDVTKDELKSMFL